uniref:PH domain-containing protein n=1 Tax=Tetraodon nigroviridis TaxID=99883 RepID=H3CD16_TETNG
QEGQELIQEQPELRPVVQQKLEEIRQCWAELETTTKARARQLFEQKAQLEVQNYSDLDHQLSHLDHQLSHLDHQLSHLEQQPPQLEVMESQVGDLYKNVGQLGGFQTVCLAEPRVGAAEAEGEELEARAETRIVRLIEPLKERRRILLASKEMHQVAQDLEDEMLWIQERLPLATSKDHGSSFHSVQQQAKANQKLQRELASRRARIAEVLDRAGMIASLRTPEVDFVREGAEHVHQLWAVLQAETERRSAVLNAALQAQQYYSEAAKVEAWLADQKLQLATEDKGLDEVSTLQLLKGHQSVEQTVEAYAESVGLLSQQCQQLLEVGHPESKSEQIMKQQSHIGRLYLSVKDMVEHRKTKLEQQYWLYQLHKDVEELDKWITEREVVASSTELGQDLEDVTVLQETFSQFVCETNSLGQQRLEQLNKLANEMIKCGHSDAATIAEWKDGLNESWADLLELMETRTQMLAASQQLHRFFTDCKEVARWPHRQPVPPVPLLTASRLCRSSRRLQMGLTVGLTQVRQLQENASQLRTIYAGEKAEAILGQEQEVLEAWRQLLSCCEANHVQVTSVTDKVQFFSVVRENLMWMEGIMGQIRWEEPRDSAALEMMIRQHQELKGKIDGRSKTLQQCGDLGRVLIAAGDPASEEIKEKLDSLLVKQRDLVEKWGSHEEKLHKKQERFHVVQETVQPEVWLKATEPERGEAQAQKDEVEQLILRHQAFRKAAVTWKERFSSLRQLSATEKKQEEISITPHHSVVGSGFRGHPHPGGGGTTSTNYLPQGQCSSGLASSAYLAKSGGLMEARLGYAWQNVNSELPQPRVNSLHKAVNPLLEARAMQGHRCGEAPPANMRGPETGLELLHGRLQRDPRGSRSDPQMDHLRQEREYKLGRQTSSEQEIQARLNELPMMVRQERYRRHLERQSSSEKEGSSKQRLQSEKRSTMAEIVEQVQEREAAHALSFGCFQTRGETYRPSSSLSAPVTRFDGRPRARDRPKPRRRPRPKEPEEARRSRSAPATGAPTTPQPPSHTAQNEGFLYRKKVTTSDLEGQQRSPNSKSWVNIYCVLKEGKLTFYKDARNHNTTYNEEPPVDLSTCSFDPSMGYKKKKNVFILQTDDGNFF